MSPAATSGSKGPKSDSKDRPANVIVLFLSGPNLNLLGSRQPEIYGTSTLEDHITRATSIAAARGLTLEHVQSNTEGVLVEAVQGARNRVAAIVINAGALTHYSWALHDALAAFDGPKIELHLSNTHAREPWRHTSVIAPVVQGSIQGFGGHGYDLAVDAAARLLGR
jgi:3-dehydroquinate dehydratase II